MVPAKPELSNVSARSAQISALSCTDKAINTLYMALQSNLQHMSSLERLSPGQNHAFAIPVKHIQDGADLQFFLASIAYRDINAWLLQLNRSMFPVIGSTRKTFSHDSPTLSENVNSVRSILDALLALIEQAPPSTGPRRFGNVAFRDWYKLAEDQAHDLLERHLGDFATRYGGDDGSQRAPLLDEIRSYLLGSFGSAQRLDYGTGHELSWLAFLGCLWKLGAFEDGEERSIVLNLVQPYFQLIRRLILTYTLEPAGSHGVWGLDDHSFLPYIFGSAQYGPRIDPTRTEQVPTEGSLDTAPLPAKVTSKAEVADYKDSNMYFSAIQFIYDVKRGPFWEHSPVLYDISGIKDGWAKINKGMLKMYAAEVLGKFPVVQHFPFGSFLKWEKDPDFGEKATSMHTQQQPVATKKTAVPVQSRLGTAAPWAKAEEHGSGIPQMQSSTGVPSTRAPWAR